MQTINKGQRLKLVDLQLTNRFDVVLAGSGPGLSIDFACFGLDAASKLSDERYMTFFNQPTSPCSGVTLDPSSGGKRFSLDLDRLPATIDRLTFTAALDGAGAMGQLSAGSVSLVEQGQEKGKFSFAGTDFKDERALMLAEIYRKDGAWRISATAQGFNGGLDALVRHFGGDVADSAPAAPAAPAAPNPAAAQAARKIDLEKRIAAQAPQLLDLTKKAAISLEKAGMGAHRARVALVLDISGSMSGHYSRGLVQKFAERILALGCQFDDDGQIDIFLFGRNVHQPEPMDLGNCQSYVRGVIQRHPLEGDTRYGAAIQAVRRHYFPENGAGNTPPAVRKVDTPVYVMFLTDGNTSDESLTERQIRAASYEGIFWQFIGIGNSSKTRSGRSGWFGGSDFQFLEDLDNLHDRFIDNADFFSVSSPDEHPDNVLYDLLMQEYPGWVKTAQGKGLIA